MCTRHHGVNRDESLALPAWEEQNLQASMSPQEPTRLQQVEKEDGGSFGRKWYVRKQMGAMFADCKMPGLVEVWERAKESRVTGAEEAGKVSSPSLGRGWYVMEVFKVGPTSSEQSSEESNW